MFPSLCQMFCYRNVQELNILLDPRRFLHTPTTQEFFHLFFSLFNYRTVKCDFQPVFKKKDILTHVTSWLNLKSIISQPPKDKFSDSISVRYLVTDRKYSDGHQGMGKGKVGNSCLTKFQFCKMRKFWRWRLPSIRTALSTTELYT
jgi:hypothetical protein